MPDLSLERELLASGAQLIGGVDEVGRGSLAGPVCVGIAIVDASTAQMPVGLDDSKVLSPVRRAALEPVIAQWARAVVIGTADSHEIDAVGIVAAMRLAAIRAFDQLSQRGLEPDAVILDGSHNWLRSDSLFEEDDSRVLDRLQGHVHTKVKADRACASVAAASVMAKQHRDRRMIALDREYPQYQWSGNKGYASAGHIQALASVGPSPFHRLSWSLPGIVPTP